MSKSFIKGLRMHSLTRFDLGSNSLIQAAKARGYRNPDNLIAMAYLIAGKFRFSQPT